MGTPDPCPARIAVCRRAYTAACCCSPPSATKGENKVVYDDVYHEDEFKQYLAGTPSKSKSNELDTVGAITTQELHPLLPTSRSDLANQCPPTRAPAYSSPPKPSLTSMGSVQVVTGTAPISEEPPQPPVSPSSMTVVHTPHGRELFI